jgi:hypothetical protein
MIAEQIENAEAPPPDGSTATKKCSTFNLRTQKGRARRVMQMCSRVEQQWAHDV